MRGRRPLIVAAVSLAAISLGLAWRVGSLGAELEESERLSGTRSQRVLELEQQLQLAFAQRDALAKAADAIAESRRQELASKAEKARKERQPPPEGVRLCVQSLNGLLTKSGNGGLRVLEATELTDDKALLGVEMIDSDLASGSRTLYLPERLMVVVDRAKATATLLMQGGTKNESRVRSPLPDGGFSIVLEGIVGVAWEASLPALVRAVGVYPEDVPQSRKSRLDPVANQSWRTRINDLLALASGDLTWRCEHFESLEQGSFKNALLTASNRGHLIERSAEPARFAIKVDTKLGTVAIWLSGGKQHLRTGGVDIPESGFEILLLGLTPKQAREAMLGLVAGE